MELNRKTRLHDMYLQDKVASTVFRNSRSVFLRHGPMKKGRYVAVPTTFDAGVEADFLFRVYTENSNDYT